MGNRKTYLITGGSEGIGLAVAKMASHEANVVLVARDPAKLESALEQLATGDHSYISADLSKPGEAKRVVEETVAKYGRLDGLVNSAGMFLEKPFVDCTLDEMDRVFGLNFRATLETCHAALPHMSRQKSGVIVNVSSMAGIKTYQNEVAYGSSKAAVNKLTEQLFAEYKKTAIRVFAVAPGSVDTPLLRKALDPQRAFFEKEVFKTFTLDDYYRRILKPEDVASKVVELIRTPGSQTEPIVPIKSYEF